MDLKGLKSDFEILDDWEDRYRHVIELGRELPPFDESQRIPANKVQGCASQVWLVVNKSGPSENPVLTFSGDSDALIVKGLVAIALMIFSGRNARDILEIDAASILDELGLTGNLTPQRSNGFASMIQRIKSFAAEALQASPSAGIAGR
jgi:cysteine desulfuration protein SufE